jgi:hypothetical protein
MGPGRDKSGQPGAQRDQETDRKHQPPVPETVVAAASPPGMRAPFATGKAERGSTGHFSEILVAALSGAPVSGLRRPEVAPFF